MKHLFWGVLFLSIVAGVFLRSTWLLAEAAAHRNGPKTVEERVKQYGAKVEVRLKPDFVKAGIVYPPGSLTLVVFKQEKRFEVYAATEAGAVPGEYRFIRSYPILAASGELGPKLKRGDKQVPEGLYAVDSLNPNSRYHLALRVNYPNARDKELAAADGRADLGGDIMIHGNEVSIGCVALGDAAAEDLFVLTAQAGLPNTHLILSPLDFRTVKKVPLTPGLPAWTPKLYAEIRDALATLPLPPAQTAPSSP